jgi:phage/plasmid-like protein (TIGR03299 family)
MAHELNFNQLNKTWSFASNAEKAWHDLGQVVDGAMTAEEAIKLANLDYTVEKANVYMKTQDETDVQVEGYYSTYRTDTNQYLGMVKSRYEVVQNKDAFSFFDSIIDAGEAIFETAGALGNGERIFLSAKLPDDFVIGTEKIEKYIMLTNSHNATSSVVAGLTNVRVVCNNTLQAALNGLENKVSISHIIGAKDKIKEAYKVMGIASKYNLQVEQMFNQMLDVKMSEGDMATYFTKVLKPDYISIDGLTQQEMSTRLQNAVDMTLDFAYNHPTQKTVEATGTLWGAYNAISGVYNYGKKYKNSEDKFNQQFFGTANKKMLKSFDEAMILVN